VANVMEAEFRKMGARVKVKTNDRVAIRVDVRRDHVGEYFEVRHRPGVRVSVPDVTPWDRHLLLRVQSTAEVAQDAPELD
jgi:hypothetical protein